MIGVLDGVREGRLERSDGRTVAWTEWGDRGGVPVLRIPGTPGSRYGTRADKQPWIDRNLRIITTERPGFGASTRLPGRGFAEHADDLAAVLDELGITSIHVMGGSGGSPHILALAERHHERVRAATVIVGTAPLEPSEVAAMIPTNIEAHDLVVSGDLVRLRARTAEIRGYLLQDPIAGIRSIMETAPPADRSIMSDPVWQEAFAVQLREGLRAGVEGWVDEVVAVEGDWSDIHPERITTSVTWWHSDADRNCPISAAERLVGRLPNARLHVWHDAGHLESYLREGEILDELLAR